MNLNLHSCRPESDRHELEVKIRFGHLFTNVCGISSVRKRSDDIEAGQPSTAKIGTRTRAPAHLPVHLESQMLKGLLQKEFQKLTKWGLVNVLLYLSLPESGWLMLEVHVHFTTLGLQDTFINVWVADTPHGVQLLSHMNMFF